MGLSSDFFCTQLNGFKYCYASLTIQLNFHHLFTHSSMIYLFLTIQFCISYLFVLSLNVKQFYLTHRWDPIKVLPLLTRVNLGAMAMKGYSTFPKAGTSPSDFLSYPGQLLR